MKHRAMQMADDLGPVLGKPIRKAPETKAQPAPRWEKTSTKGYLRDPATGAVARDADVPFDRQPLTKPASCVASGAAGTLKDGDIIKVSFDLASAPDKTVIKFRRWLPPDYRITPKRQWIASGAAGEEVTQVDSDGWIAHDGGECPIPDARAGEGELRFESGSERVMSGDAGRYDWGHMAPMLRSDITAYRLLPAYHARKAREAIPVGEATEVPSEEDVRAANIAALKRLGRSEVADSIRMGAIYRYGSSISAIAPHDRAACIAALNALARPEPAKPAVQTMLVDGVAYREAPEISEDFRCAGCAFVEKACFNDLDHMRAAVAKFGGQCRDRDVIYIRAEAA